MASSLLQRAAAGITSSMRATTTSGVQPTSMPSVIVGPNEALIERIGLFFFATVMLFLIPVVYYVVGVKVYKFGERWYHFGSVEAVTQASKDLLFFVTCGRCGRSIDPRLLSETDEESDDGYGATNFEGDFCEGISDHPQYFKQVHTFYVKG